MRWKTLSPESTLLMKGIAILMIATHNFMHLFPFPKENEFDFSIERTSNMIALLGSEPENSLRVLLSYFGHYGVEVFIFLSAYGLTKKYINHPPVFFNFIIDRIKKVFPTFIIAIGIWLTLEGFYSYGLFGPIKMLYWNFENIILKLTLISNFFPEKALEPIGPWWFIPFIFQFYFVFPFLLKAYDRWQSIGLIFLSIFCLMFSYTVDGYLFNINLYYTIVPYMPVFALGIYLAKQDISSNEINFSPIFIGIAALIFILGNVNQHLWVLSNISFTILFLTLMNFVLPKVTGNFSKVLLFTGQISMGIFLVNGFLRFPMIHWATAADNWFLTIALCLLSLGASYVVAIFLHRIERKVTSVVKMYISKRIYAVS